MRSSLWLLVLSITGARKNCLARDGRLTGEVLATAQVHATLALAAATALVGGGRIEADAWREVAGTRFAELPPVPAG